MSNVAIGTIVLAVITGCLVFGRLLAEGPPSFSLVDRECHEAQEQYYRAQERRAASQDQPPSDQKQYLEEEHNHADVCAQHRMANAAEYGLLLLFLTLCFSASAAIAAWRTVNVMNGSANRQLRAYIAVTKVKIRETDSGYMPNVCVTIKNFGQTPAYNVVHRSEYDFHSRFGPLALKPLEEITEKMVVAPGQAPMRGMLIPLLEWDENSSRLDSSYKPWTDALTLYVFGEIAYDTVFEKGLVTRYRFKLSVDDEGVNDKCPFHFCPDGNEST